MNTLLTDNEIRSKLKTYFKNNFFVNLESDDFSDDSSFLEKGIIDSTGVLELINFIQDDFGITVADEELLPSNLDSINSITAFVQRKSN